VGEGHKGVESAVWNEQGGAREQAMRGVVQSCQRQAGTKRADRHAVAGDAETGCRAIGEGAPS
jgi:hypothetical protein